MVAAHWATVVTGKGSDAQDSEQLSILQSILCGSKTSFRICLQSPAVSTHCWLSQIQFKCKATEQKVFVFGVYSASAPAITQLGPEQLRPISSCALFHRSPWPFYCLWLAGWCIWFVPNKDGLPFRSCHFFSAAYFSSCYLLWLNCAPPKEICTYSSDMLFCFKWFQCNFQPSKRSAL